MDIQDKLDNLNFEFNEVKEVQRRDTKILENFAEQNKDNTCESKVVDNLSRAGSASS